LVEELHRRGLAFSIGFPLEPAVRQAILATRADGRLSVRDQDEHDRQGAWVCELDGLDLVGWPPSTRAICRRERADPDAKPKIGFTDQAGHHFQVFITNQPGLDVVALEARHRGHARVEDRIRGAKASGLANLPCHGFAANDAWLTLVLFAQTLVCWTQALCLEGELIIAEPKACATGCDIPPGDWSATAAGSSCACNAPGPGRRSWWRRSGSCEPYPHAADHPQGCTRPGRRGPARHDVVVHFDRFPHVACSTSHDYCNWCFRMIVLSRGFS
jgi:hypothetical protein